MVAPTYEQVVARGPPSGDRVLCLTGNWKQEIIRVHSELPMLCTTGSNKNRFGRQNAKGKEASALVCPSVCVQSRVLKFCAVRGLPAYGTFALSYMSQGSSTAWLTQNSQIDPERQHNLPEHHV
jgi:hypothetical protein